MKREGYPDSTIKTTVNRLRNLARNCNFRDSESVKQLIASKQVSVSFKSNLCDAYEHYLRCHGLRLNRPRYKREKGLPKVATAENVEKIIARCCWRYATVFSVLRHTRAMPEELHRVK
jgi:hypothetical protein